MNPLESDGLGGSDCAVADRAAIDAAYAAWMEDLSSGNPDYSVRSHCLTDVASAAPVTPGSLHYGLANRRGIYVAEPSDEQNYWPTSGGHGGSRRNPEQQPERAFERDPRPAPCAGGARQPPGR